MLLRKAKFACFLLQFTPFIRMVALSGSVARGEAQENSDIDFLIITKENRIWAARAISVIIMAVFGLKRYKNKIRARVCLNLYQTEDHLRVTGPADQKWLAHNYAYTLPLWQKGNLFLSFVRSNQWIKKYNENFYCLSYQPNLTENILAFTASFFRLIFEFLFDLCFGDWGEKILKSYQTKRILKDTRTLESRPGQIFLSDKELRFHPSKYLK